MQNHLTPFDDLIGRNSANSITFQGTNNQEIPLLGMSMSQTAGFPTSQLNVQYSAKHRDKSFTNVPNSRFGISDQKTDQHVKVTNQLHGLTPPHLSNIHRINSAS